MTMIAAHSSIAEAILVADCRLSIYDPSQRTIVAARDGCQKIFTAGTTHVVGFAGDLCLGRFLAGVLFHLLRMPNSVAGMSPLWIQEDDEIRAFLKRAVRHHVQHNHPHHRGCGRSVVELMIAWMAPAHGDRDLAISERRPGFDVIPEIVVVRHPSMAITRTRMGFSYIGSGSSISTQLGLTEWLSIANFANGNSANGSSLRGVFFTEMVNTLIEEQGDEMVGGLYQVLVIGSFGVLPVPYFVWRTIQEGYGTYVAMRIEDGGWIQEHRPTSTLARVRSPFDIATKGPDWRPGNFQLFDPRSTLAVDSPGVVPERNPRAQFVLYDPDDFHEEVRGAWGDRPIPPITWRDSKVPEMMSKRQWRRYRRGIR